MGDKSNENQDTNSMRKDKNKNIEEQRTDYGEVMRKKLEWRRAHIVGTLQSSDTNTKKD